MSVLDGTQMTDGRFTTVLVWTNATQTLFKDVLPMHIQDEETLGGLAGKRSAQRSSACIRQDFHRCAGGHHPSSGGVVTVVGVPLWLNQSTRRKGLEALRAVVQGTKKIFKHGAAIRLRSSLS